MSAFIVVLILFMVMMLSAVVVWWYYNNILMNTVATSEAAFSSSTYYTRQDINDCFERMYATGNWSMCFYRGTSNGTGNGTDEGFIVLGYGAIITQIYCPDGSCTTY